MYSEFINVRCSSCKTPLNKIGDKTYKYACQCWRRNTYTPDVSITPSTPMLLNITGNEATTPQPEPIQDNIYGLSETQRQGLSDVIKRLAAVGCDVKYHDLAMLIINTGNK